MTINEFIEKYLENKQIYICGKMTGIENYNYPKFKETTLMFRNKGVLVKCPTEVNIQKKEWDWKKYMKENIKQMLDCDVVYVLDGHETSVGAIMEIDIAEKLEIPIIYETDIEEFSTKVKLNMVNIIRNKVQKLAESKDENKTHCGIYACYSSSLLSDEMITTVLEQYAIENNINNITIEEITTISELILDNQILDKLSQHSEENIRHILR